MLDILWSNSFKSYDNKLFENKPPQITPLEQFNNSNYSRSDREFGLHIVFGVGEFFCTDIYSG